MIVGTAVETMVASSAAMKRDRNRATRIIVIRNLERLFVALSFEPFSWMSGAALGAAAVGHAWVFESSGSVMPGVAGEIGETSFSP